VANVVDQSLAIANTSKKQFYLLASGPARASALLIEESI